MIGTCLLQIQRILQILPTYQLLSRPSTSLRHALGATCRVRVDKNHRIAPPVQSGLQQLRCIQNNRPDARIGSVFRYKYLDLSQNPRVEQLLQPGQFVRITEHYCRNRLVVHLALRRANSISPPLPQFLHHIGRAKLLVRDPVEIYDRRPKRFEDLPNRGLPGSDTADKTDDRHFEFRKDSRQFARAVGFHRRQTPPPVQQTGRTAEPTNNRTGPTDVTATLRLWQKEIP